MTLLNVVVTGASSGIGRAIARAFGERRAQVALIARGEDGLHAAAAEVRAAGGEALVLPLDLGNAADVAVAARRVAREWGSIDVWINDAMVSVLAPVDETTPEEYRRVLEVNFLGAVHGTLAALEQMRPRDAGTIIQIGSALAYRSIPLQSAYCASKAAMRAFTDSLRCELLHEKSRIRVVMVQLPAVNTPQFEVVRNKLGGHARPVPPVYQPEVIARAVLRAVDRPRREVWIGGSILGAIVGQRLVPGLLDRYLARRAWRAQVTRALPPTRRDNLYLALPGDRGAHGSFDDEARAHSVQARLRAHAVLVAAGIAALALGAARWRRR